MLSYACVDHDTENVGGRITGGVVPFWDAEGPESAAVHIDQLRTQAFVPIDVTNLQPCSRRGALAPA